ncbi:MAG TPA: hypothetical protein VK666_03640, partial [Chryseolinea sp.]|nr:hypothetical protein [Chryseolinea sp.]
YDNGATSNSQPVTNDYLLMQPYSYLALTERTDLLASAYPLSHIENLLQVALLPSMNDDQGSIVLMDAGDSIMDNVQYSASMHSVFIQDAEGVSLERVSPASPSSDTQNWKSGIAEVGFATPGYLNSNAWRQPLLTAGKITVDPKAFIPLSGQPNFTRIGYAFDQGGYIANVGVYDERGRLVKQITRNEILGTEGGFTWEGDRDDGYRVRTGYYMIRFEVFDATGVVRIFKKSVAIGARF